MIIKEINIFDNFIEIIEEKKGIFGIKKYVSNINIKSISKVEKLINNNKLIGIILWNKDEVLHAIGFKNYKENLEDIYNKIFKIIKNSTSIIETEL